jgi:hypothetical protein
MKTTPLFIGSLLSISILALLFGIKMYQPALLDIDAKWLCVAAVPVIIALLVSGIISKFKGFGVEIEVAAKSEIVDNPSVMTLLTPLLVKQKGEVTDLNPMTEEEKRTYNSLAFQLSNPNIHYIPFAITEYLRQLPNVRYFEITDQNGAFIALWKIDRKLFKEDNTDYIYNFIQKLESGEWKGITGKITDKFVLLTTTILEALSTMRHNTLEFVPVLNDPEEKRLRGVIEVRKIEAFLADKVLRSYKR